MFICTRTLGATAAVVISLFAFAGADRVDAGAASGCPPFPAFPDESCTGWQHTGATLTTYTGPTTITTNGTVIENKQINSSLTIKANNVTIRRSQVNGRIDTGFGTYSGTLIEDVRVIGGGFIGSCIGNTGYVARRVHVSGCSIGLWLANGAQLHDSYVHNLHGGCQNGSNSHGAGVASPGSSQAKPNTMIHNRIIANLGTQGTWCNNTGDPGGISAAVTMYTHGDFWGTQSYQHFEKNLLGVGTGSKDRGSFCLYPGSSTTDRFTNNRFFDNRFTRDPINPSRCGLYGTISESTIHSSNCWQNNGFADGSIIPMTGVGPCGALTPPQAPQSLRLLQ